MFFLTHQPVYYVPWFPAKHKEAIKWNYCNFPADGINLYYRKIKKKRYNIMSKSGKRAEKYWQLNHYESGGYIFLVQNRIQIL